MARISKNARRSEVQQLICGCGGTIKMKTVAQRGGRLRHFARCDKCKKEARRPRDLFAC